MKVKRVLRKINKFFRRYINGGKGAVSLLLVLVMAPLMTMSLTLVESARYQDAVQLMDEIIDLSSFSTLAEYDSFLDERFGLLSVSQETSINSEFSDYLDKNTPALGDSISINSASASGVYPLSNKKVLKQQLLEYGEISVAVEAVTEGIDLDVLLEKLQKSLDLEEFKEEVDAVNAGIDLAAEVESLVENIIEAKNRYDNEYSTALSDYKNAYKDFESKGNALITALEDAKTKQEEAAKKEAESEENSDETTEETPTSVTDIYDDKDVQRALNNLYASRDTYKNCTSTLKSELSELKDNIEGIISSAEALPGKIDEFEDATSEADLAADCTTTTSEWLDIIVSQIVTTFDTIAGANFSDTANTDLNNLQTQINDLAGIGQKTITADWTTSDIDDEYGTVTIKSIKSSFSTMMSELVSKLNEEAAVNDESSANMTNLLDLVTQLLGFSGLYNSNLNSSISDSCLYSNTTMSFSSQMSVNSITSLMDACENFTESIKSLNLIKALKALVDLLEAVVSFLASIIAWIAEVICNAFVTVFSGPNEMYNNLLLYGYGAYNLPNRTNFDSGKTLSGYSYSKIYNLAGGTSANETLTGSLKDFAKFDEVDGSDKLFKGAEAEYILVGSKSERQNQSVTFFNLYMLRLCLDIFPVLKNGQLSSIAAAAGPGAWVVKLAAVLAEPLIDTFVLCNGGKEYFFKDTIYLSYSGFVILQKDLIDLTDLSGLVQGKVKDMIKEHNGDPTEKGWCDGSYTEHMLLLMMLTVNQTTYLQRLQNIIQMEAKEKHKDDFSFNLNKSYTYIKSNVKYELNPMFDIDSLTASGVFGVNDTQYFGY